MASDEVTKLGLCFATKATKIDSEPYLIDFVLALFFSFPGDKSPVTEWSGGFI